jgi:hypothetical protein
MKKYVLSFAASLAMLLSYSLPIIASGSVVVDRVVAVVNNEIITLSDLQREEALKKVDVSTNACSSRT